MISMSYLQITDESSFSLCGSPGQGEKLKFLRDIPSKSFSQNESPILLQTHKKNKTEKEPHQLHFSDPFFTQLASGLQINIVFY